MKIDDEQIVRLVVSKLEELKPGMDRADFSRELLRVIADLVSVPDGSSQPEGHGGRMWGSL